MEISSRQFYIHKNYYNSYYYVYKALEDWIANNIFRQDSSRVFLASSNYVFRRRFELTDMSQNFEDIEISHLNFPFASYWPLNTGWTSDDRLAGVNVAMVYSGIFVGDTKIRAISSSLSIPVTFYFDREDDARMAFEMLYFKQINEHYYSVDMPFNGNVLGLPISMTISGLSFNPSRTESDWLNNNRIFTIEATFGIRTYVIQSPLQPKFDSQLDGFNEDGDIILSDGSIYNPGFEKYYLTEEVITNMFNYNDILTSEIRVDGTIFDNSIKINKLAITEIDTISGKLSWEYPTDEENPEITSIEIILMGDSKVIEINPRESFYVFNDLTPGSFYVGYITFKTASSSKQLGFTFTTLESLDVIKQKEAPKSSLIGLSW